MANHMIYSRRPRIPSDPAAAFGEENPGFDSSPPVRFDRPVGAVLSAATSPVTNERLGNDQEMASGADSMSGVVASSVSGGDYSREQGVGRAPGWRWPWNEHSVAFNLTSLDRWMIERSDAAVTLPVHVPSPLTLSLNPYDAPYPSVPHSPITAMDQLTNYYENDPDQWFYFSPPPVTIPDENGAVPAFTEQAVLY